DFSRSGARRPTGRPTRAAAKGADAVGALRRACGGGSAGSAQTPSGSPSRSADSPRGLGGHYAQAGTWTREAARMKPLDFDHSERFCVFQCGEHWFALPSLAIRSVVPEKTITPI